MVVGVVVVEVFVVDFDRFEQQIVFGVVLWVFGGYFFGQVGQVGCVDCVGCCIVMCECYGGDKDYWCGECCGFVEYDFVFGVVGL